jgi:nicotinamidase-related amidase
MNIALFVIDMQKAFFANDSKKSMEKAVEYINYTVDLFRENNLNIIWIQDEDEEDGNISGTEGFEIIDLLKQKDSEKRIVKHYGNSFNKTELREYLINEKIDTIIITGYCAEYCVLSTYRGALDLDLTPIILKNAIASGNKENITFVESISEIITIGVLEKIIKGK